MQNQRAPGPTGAAGFLIENPDLRTWLVAETERQFAFFASSQKDAPGLHTLDPTGALLPDDTQELLQPRIWCIPTRLASFGDMLRPSGLLTVA